MNKNKIEITGFVTNTIKSGNKVSFGMAIGKKVGEDENNKPIFKTGFINVKGSFDKLNVKSRDRIILTGYFSFDFYYPKGSNKEVSRLIFIGLSSEVL